jgi:CcmD family protein
VKTGVHAAVMVVVALMLTLAASAQTPDKEFGPPTDIARDPLPTLPMLYLAYAVVWLVLIGYVFLLWRRIGRVERELADVHARLPKR